METSATTAVTRDRWFFLANAIVSTAAVSLIAWLLYAPRALPTGVDLRFMPAVNAVLNACAAVCLASGFVAIRRGQRSLHRALMLSAFVCSGLFLVGYLAYHHVHGDTRYAGTGVLKAVYLAILASHVLLSIAVVPMAFTTLYFASRGTFARHRKLARWTLPLWLYVSVTGVVVFAMLRMAS